MNNKKSFNGNVYLMHNYFNYLNCSTKLMCILIEPLNMSILSGSE